MIFRSRPHWYPLFPVALLGFVAFVPSLGNYFSGEDFVFIKAASENHPFFESTQRLFYRPLPNLFWQLDFSFWELNPAGYHLTNLLLHILNSLLTGFLAFKLTGRKGMSWGTAALFALHPIHAEPVAWLASRPDLLATFFCLISLLSGLAFFGSKVPKRDLWLYFLSLLSFGAGLFSKEAAASLPVALFGLLIMGKPNWDFRKLVPGFLPYLLPLLGYGLARLSNLGGFGGYNTAGRDLLNLGWNLTGGLWFPLLFPLNLESAGTLVDIFLVGFLIAIYGLTGFLIFQSRKRVEGKLLLSGLILIYGTIFPALTTSPVEFNLAQSRILYLPSVGFCLLAAYLVYHIIQGRFKSSLKFLFPVGFLFFSFILLQINLAPWKQAGEVVKTTFSSINRQTFNFKQGDTLYFGGLPDNFNGAYTWRNGLEQAASLFYGLNLGGFNRNADLKVNYRLAEKGRVWFLDYDSSNKPKLKLSRAYFVGPELPGNSENSNPNVDWDFKECDFGGWNWRPGSGKIVCQVGGGILFDSRGQKTGVVGQSPEINFPFKPGKVFILDLSVYADFDFEQPVIQAEGLLGESIRGEQLYNFNFDLAADGKYHTYRFFLFPEAFTGNFTLTLKANKVRSNILWQKISFGVANS